MRIRIIDSKDDRAAKLCELLDRFNALPKPRLQYVPEGKELADELNSKPDLFVLHISDQTQVIEVGGQIEIVPSNEFLQSIAEQSPDSIVIVYSGGSLTAKRKSGVLEIQSDDAMQWQIHAADLSRFFVASRPVSTGSEFVQLNILAALELYSSDRDITRFAQTLQDESAPEFLLSLSWLCQGYLAVTDPTRLEPNQELQTVITSWSLSKLAEKRATVSSCRWWKKSFKPLKLSELRSRVREEWKSERDWLQVEQLLDAIGGTRRIPLETVTSAYEAISRRLKEYPG